MTRGRASVTLVTFGFSMALIVVACGGGAASPTPLVTPTRAPTATPTSAPAATASPAAIPTGPATLDAPDTISGGSPFQVAWTGPNAQGDYVTIVSEGATRWTNEQFFYTTTGSPGTLTAPTTAGNYELWYVNGADSAVTARRPITVTAFAGTLTGPATVPAGTVFSVAWTGPNGPGDYVTIVAEGATRWTNESYFYTAAGTSGSLTAPLAVGNYELWYVTGADSKTMARAPIAVEATPVSVVAPIEVDTGAQFEVTWAGPNGPGDYITIVEAGSPEGAYLSYAYTAAGNPASLTAPDTGGAYEVRYVSGQGEVTQASALIAVK